MRIDFTPQWIEKFWSRVDKTLGHGPDGKCWPWMLGCTAAGYGMAWQPAKTGVITTQPIYAHRAAYLIAVGDIPDDLPKILHTCDNRPCCNPAHLFAGTDADNIHDMWSKGRAVTPIMPMIMASAEKRRRITPTMKADIRRLCETTDLFQNEIAAMFGISKGAVSSIVNRLGSYHD